MKVVITEVTKVTVDMIGLTTEETDMIRISLLARAVHHKDQGMDHGAKEYRTLYNKIFNAQFKAKANGKD